MSQEFYKNSYTNRCQDSWLKNTVFVKILCVTATILLPLPATGTTTAIGTTIATAIDIATTSAIAHVLIYNAYITRTII